MTMICWVCGGRLGSSVTKPNEKTTCSVVLDPGGTEHRVHHKCAKDADGKLVRTEKVLLP